MPTHTHIHTHTYHVYPDDSGCISLTYNIPIAIWCPDFFRGTYLYNTSRAASYRSYHVTTRPGLKSIHHGEILKLAVTCGWIPMDDVHLLESPCFLRTDVFWCAPIW